MLPSIFVDNLFDDFFDDAFGRRVYRAGREAEHALYGKHAAELMKTDVRDAGTAYEVCVDLPGFKKGEVKAELKDGYLTIKAERHADNNQSDASGRVIRSERFAGTCQRTFYVGDHVKREDVSAAYEDSVLKLNIPKKVEQPKVDVTHLIDIQ